MMMTMMTIASTSSVNNPRLSCKTPMHFPFFINYSLTTMIVAITLMFLNVPTYLQVCGT